MSPLRILHLEDNPEDAELVRRLLRAQGITCAVTCVRRRTEFAASLENQPFDLILSDYSLPGFNGLSALEIAKEKAPDCPLIFLSGTMGEETAIDCLKRGATDYVLKDRPARLAIAIQRAMREAAEQTARNQAQERIREQAALLDKAQDAIWVAYLNGHIHYWNKGAERLHGWTSAEVIGRSAKDFLYKDAARFQQALEPLLQQGEWTGEMTNKTKAGGEVLVQTRWSLVRDSRGAPCSILSIDTDITDRKKTEVQILRAQRMETIGALAGGIAHDLNNALAPILMGIDVLRAESGEQRRHATLDAMNRSARRCAEMVRQILAFARGVGGAAAMLDVRHLLTEMSSLLKGTFPQSIQIRYSISPRLYPVIGNVTQLHQVLLNLCVNARDAMPRGGMLEISAANIDLVNVVTRWQPEPITGAFVVLSIEDTGEGMSEEILDKIFSPFFTTKAVGHGTGLGLSTVLGIVKGHGGFLEVASQVGHGSRFKVYLPAAANSSPPFAESAEAALPTGNGEQILVVDHELAILEMTRETLETFQYRALCANDGPEAVRLYQRHHTQINAVVIDLSMPVMDGPTTVQALRGIDPQVPVIGVSGLGAGTRSVEKPQWEIQAFLEKPYSTRELLVALRSVLEKGGSS